MKKQLTFPHDYNARNNPKLQNVLSTLGVKGIGLYWCLIEQLYEQGGKIALNQCNCIAFALHLDCKCITRLISEFGLFENDGEFFWSNKVLTSINQRVGISQKRKSAASKRWNGSNTDANAMQMHNTCVEEKENKKEKEKFPPNPLIKEKEINKEKEDDIFFEDNNNLLTKNNIKEKKTKTKTKKVFSEFEQQFEDFRQHYPGIKRGFQKELDNFKKKYPNWKDLLPLLIPAVDRLISYTEQRRARGEWVAEYPHLQTWLNQSRWEVEFPTINEQQTTNNDHYKSTAEIEYERRQAEFRDYITRKLATPYVEPDISEYY